MTKLEKGPEEEVRESMRRWWRREGFLKSKSPKVQGFQGPMVQGSQGPRYLKVSFKYELDCKKGPSCYVLNHLFYLVSTKTFPSLKLCSASIPYQILGANFGEFQLAFPLSPIWVAKWMKPSLLMEFSISWLTPPPLALNAFWWVAENIWKMTPPDPPSPPYIWKFPLCFLQILFESFPNTKDK